MGKIIKKTLTKVEYESGRIALSAKVRKHYLANVGENSKTPVILEDENGYMHNIFVKVRDKAQKSEIMAKGGKELIQKIGLLPGDVLLFPLDESATSPGTNIRLAVENNPLLQLTLSIASL